jgi:hypothetical protein
MAALTRGTLTNSGIALSDSTPIARKKLAPMTIRIRADETVPAPKIIKNIAVNLTLFMGCFLTVKRPSVRGVS